MVKAGNTGVAPLGATRVFPLSSFCLYSRNRIHRGISLVDPGDATLCLRSRPLLLPPLLPSAAAADAAIGRYHCRLHGPDVKIMFYS